MIQCKNVTGIWTFAWINPVFIWVEVDTTESSGEGTNSFSISDRSFLSAISGEVVDDSSLVSQSSQQQLALCRTPSLRKNSSPALVKKKPGLPPKPQHLAKPQTQVNMTRLKNYQKMRGPDCENMDRIKIFVCIFVSWLNNSITSVSLHDRLMRL